MRAWLDPLLANLERGGAAALVHVVRVAGSGPREAGAQMLVTEAGSHGTIGGGELEHQAILQARTAMETGRAGLIHLKLGPDLGQCCGGSVTLAVEPFAPADLAWIKHLRAAAGRPEPVFRRVRIEGGGLRRDWSAGGEGADFAASLRDGAVELRERMNPPPPELWLFGAGHVGRAVVQALAPLGFAITWVDGREGQFPEPPPGVRTFALAMPELIVEEAAPGASYLVMTHSHPLDEAICEAVLRRGDFAYLGLIGSKTKRARFRRRLAASGIAPAMLDRLTCPIGLAAIRSKEPAAIAASVAADLLIRREAALAQPTAGLDHGR